MTDLEKIVQRDIIRFFEGLGCTVYRLSQARATRQTPGLPDLYIFCQRKRVAFWWETKRTDTGQRSDAQLDFAGLCADCRVAYGHGAYANARAMAQKLGLMWSAAA